MKTQTLPEHGTPQRYWRGCKCKPCIEANRVYYEQRRRNLGVLSREDRAAEAHARRVHGTTAMYQYGGCRCVRCKKANADAQRDYTHRSGRHRPFEVVRAERRANPPPHGTESRYTSVWKCRCKECREAATDARRRRREGKVAS